MASDIAPDGTASQQGARALDRLRDGVERAIVSLGTGFLAHPDNRRLRQGLASGELGKREYYRQLLRLVYRCIFLFAAEERGALPDPDAPEQARARYHQHCATRRLRLCPHGQNDGQNRGWHDSQRDDLWRALAVVMDKLDAGYPPLGLPALGSRLWSKEACPWLMDAGCANQHLLAAVGHLSYIEDGQTRYPVDWKSIGADELGRIYESLLELHPAMQRESGAFELATAAGHERKTTGSYYTPTSLVDCLLDSALDPVLDEACADEDPEAAILALTVCDPACGSGHFLVAAARRMAHRLAVVRSTVRSEADAPSPDDMRAALRDVVGRCIYGVDINPMAVELCKMSLWMEALAPGEPLSLLDNHIQCGNALLGATPALMARGIPERAFTPIEGDDKAVARRLKKRNKNERKGQQSQRLDMGEGRSQDDCQAVSRDAAQVDRAVEREWHALERSAASRDAWFRADAWCAAFVWPKQAGEDEAAAVTHGAWVQLAADVSAASERMRDIVQQVAREYQFFHWHLAFPQVFRRVKATMEKGEEGEATGWTGGFDVVLGNPPWERIKLQEKEFFGARNIDIANAGNAADRKEQIARLEKDDPALWDEWRGALRRASGQSLMVRDSGRYPLCGRGDVNTYSIFAELNRELIAESGRAGFVVPSGIATDATTQFFFRDLVESNALRSFYDFQSGPGLFGEVGHARFKFCLLTLGHPSSHETAEAVFGFFLRDAQLVGDPEHCFSLSGKDIELLNPNTGTCPVFRTRRDAEITKGIYRRVPVLWREDDPAGNPWQLSLRAMLHMANDSGLFHTDQDLAPAGWTRAGNTFARGGVDMLPVYEAKMAHHFDHRFGDYADKLSTSQSTALPEVPDERLADPRYTIAPRYWVDAREVEARLEGRWNRGWLLGWRDICRSTDCRTVIASIIPLAGTGDTYLLAWPAKFALADLLLAVLNSFVLDYCARQKIGGTHLKYHVFRQLPVPGPDMMERALATSSIYKHIRSSVLELTYTAWDLRAFARDCGYTGPPFRWHDERRQLLRCELNAAFFHLYGIDRDDVGYIMETFPIVKKKDIKQYGDYRTKLIILDIYDDMQRAIDTGQPYQTWLDPPPADPRVAHPESTRPDWAPPLEA